MRGKIDCYGQTDVGCIRESNQDQFLIADLCKSIVIHHSSLGYDEQTQFSGGSRAKLFIVADGMGGHTGGERASWMAVEGVIQYMLTNLHWPITCAASHEGHFFKGLSAALEYSQDQIRTAADLCPQQGRMGTTLTMAWVVWPTVYLIHVGDSRAYLYRNGRLELLSHDQTLAQALADNGVIDPQDVDHHSYRNILVSALGCTSNMEPLYGRHELKPDDKLMICSDGLTKHVGDERIAHILARDERAEILCNRLIEDAKLRGGSDNVTTVLAQFLKKLDESVESDTAELGSEESLFELVMDGESTSKNA